MYVGAYELGVAALARSLIGRMNREELEALVARAVTDARVNMRELSQEAGLSYDTLRSWASGRRSPQPEGVNALADALERRSERLAELARELRRAARES